MQAKTGKGGGRRWSSDVLWEDRCNQPIEPSIRRRGGGGGLTHARIAVKLHFGPLEREREVDEDRGEKVRRKGGGRKKSEDEKGMRTKKRGRWKVDRGVEVAAGGVEGSGGESV